MARVLVGKDISQMPEKMLFKIFMATQCAIAKVILMDKDWMTKGGYAVTADKRKQKLKKRSQIVQHDAFQKSYGVDYEP